MTRENSGTVISVRNLCKDFRINDAKEGFWGAVKNLVSTKHTIKHAIADVSFDVQKGEFVGYVGENGAGKSTTIKILTGILVPTSGWARVNGYVPYVERIENSKRIGVVFGQRTQLWWDLPVRDSFDLLKSIYRVPEEMFRENMQTFNKVVDLNPLLKIPVRKLSLGQRMRCDLCAALLHNPEILFLDEPTIGLDVISKDSIREFLRRINRERQTTIILTTHDMDDIEQLCNRIIILDKGKILFNGLMDELKARFAEGKILEIEFNELYPNLDKVQNIAVLREEMNKKWVRIGNHNTNTSDVISGIIRSYSVKDLSIHESSLEDIVRSIYKRTAL